MKSYLVLAQALIIGLLMVSGQARAESTNERVVFAKLQDESITQVGKSAGLSEQATRRARRQASAELNGGSQFSFADEAPQRKAKVKQPVIERSSGDFTGLASFYHEPQMTASGERFNPRAMTAAHKTLPLGTRVRVTHMGSGRSVVVRINDRGPYIAGRVIDLSAAAADVIGMTSAGVARVSVAILGR